MAGAGGRGDVEVREGVAIGRDDHAGAAALAIGVEDGDRRAGDALDRGDAGCFGGEDVGVGGGGWVGRAVLASNCKMQIANCKLQIAESRRSAIRIRNSSIR